MLKTVTLFKWQHDKLTKLIEDGVIPQPSMHFVTGPVHLGKEGGEEIINDVYFHTFEIDQADEASEKFFSKVAELVSEENVKVSYSSRFGVMRYVMRHTLKTGAEGFSSDVCGTVDLQAVFEKLLK